MNRFLANDLLKLKRRDFLKAATIATAAMGLPSSMISKVEAALKDPARPPVVWLHLVECTGCTEALLRTSHPDVASLILDLISLEYHETLMAAAGHQAEENLERALEKYSGKLICVVEGGVSLKDKGIYCKISGHTTLELLKKVAKHSSMVIAYGTCASFGGVAAASPNPTGVVGVSDVVKDKPLINVPGCPPNGYNLLATIAYILTFNKLPEVDYLKRPKFAYGRKIHDHCERRPHFDEGRFVEQFGDEGHKKGYCLYKVGCKGPVTYANCPVIRFCDAGVWPVSAGHGCIGCTEPDCWDTMIPFYEHVPGTEVPSGMGIVGQAERIGKFALGAAAAGIAVHAAAGVVKKVVTKEKEEE
ncbi:hydrogenase (NiFe) small subunit HydA [Thermodesulfatator indicus DSM 15286]|uniref:Hydrogenase (NiFe) small subunit HydA n=1 Tax=Thermodesulfatator indicus (strain DSM 15286 / JCM 11887 / CIR29812) TaxID=667014 RepID=F8A9X4_THEID|nr:hydrogenase small subunit [Thermodesulfatator indicus]AEH44174.1 hydrogenase (NiFe) small subunit HydA [Thermodesulfatator indicus DSM 15286]